MYTRPPRRKRKNVRPSVKPEPTAALMGDVFRWLKLEDEARQFLAMRAFQRAAQAASQAGAPIDKNARAERLRGAILFVRVSSAAWSQHLHPLRELLLQRLQRVPGGESVRDLRFTVGPLDELPDWETPPPPPEPPPAEPRPIADEVHEALAGVKDEELREELTRLLATETARR